MDFTTFKDRVRDHPLIHRLDEWWIPLWQDHRSKIIQYGGGALAFIVLVGAYAQHRNTSNRTALVELEKLEMLYTRGSFETALTDAKGFVQNHGGTKWGGMGYFYLGNCQFHAAQYDEAKSSFEAAHKKWLPDPVRGSALVAGPQISEAKGEFQTAIDAYQALMKKSACDFLKPEILLSIARCHEQLGQLQQALEVYQESVQQFRSTPWEQKAKDRATELEAKLMAPAAPPVSPAISPQ